MSLDAAESWCNAILGLAVSTVAVMVLRWTGAWVAAPAWAVSVLFFGLSLVRARVLRAAFRRLDAA